MIILDTHIWVWLAQQTGQLRAAQLSAIAIARERGVTIGVSIISCWEIAKAVELGRIDLRAGAPTGACPNGLTRQLPRRTILDLTLPIAIEATSLRGDFHKDPCDQIIVASARMHNCSEGACATECRFG